MNKKVWYKKIIHLPKNGFDGSEISIQSPKNKVLFADFSSYATFAHFPNRTPPFLIQATHRRSVPSAMVGADAPRDGLF